MGLIKHYYLRSQEGQAFRLRKVLRELASIAPTLPGCGAFTIMTGIDDESIFIVLQEWKSLEGHKKGLAAFPSQIVEDAMTLLSEPPTEASFLKI